MKTLKRIDWNDLLLVDEDTHLQLDPDGLVAKMARGEIPRYTATITSCTPENLIKELKDNDKLTFIQLDRLGDWDDGFIEGLMDVEELEVQYITLFVFVKKVLYKVVYDLHLQDAVSKYIYIRNQYPKLTQVQVTLDLKGSGEQAVSYIRHSQLKGPGQLIEINSRGSWADDLHRSEIIIKRDIPIYFYINDI